MAAHAQVSGKARDERGVLAMVKKVHFSATVMPEERVVVHVSFKRRFGKLLYYTCSARSAAGLLCEGDVVAAVIG